MSFRLLLIGFFSVVCMGCVGSPVHHSVTYMTKQSTIADNNKALLNLQLGMPREQVLKIMGDPEKIEAYQWGTILLYRTAMTSGSYGTADADLTPLVIGKDNTLKGWGRNFYIQQAKAYDITIRNK